MDPENNFDSDTSDSWSLIDLNCDSPPELKIADDPKPKESLISEKSPTSPGQQGGDGLPQNVPGNDLNVASAYENLKNQQDFQILYRSKVFGDGDLGMKSQVVNNLEPNLDKGGKNDRDPKDIDEDTDGISVISESEYNDIKVTAYESDEAWDEKQSDSDVAEKPQSNILRRKRKILKLNYRESSEESVNSDVANEENYSPKAINLKRSDNIMQRKQFRPAPIHRSTFTNSLFGLTVGVVFTGLACIAIIHFLGLHVSHEATGNMVRTLKRLQMENILLHTRLSQLSRAIIMRGGDKLDFTQNSGGNQKTGYGIDENNDGGGDDENEEKIDLSQFFDDPYHALNFEDVKTGNERLFDKGAPGPFKFFNISKYVEDYYRIEKAVNDMIDIKGMRERAIEMTRPRPTRQDQRKTFRRKARDNGAKQEDGKLGGKGNQVDAATIPDTKTEKKGLDGMRGSGEFRWFLFKDRPQPSGIKTDNLVNDYEPEYSNEAPPNGERPGDIKEDLGNPNTVTEERNFLEDKDAGEEMKSQSDEKSVGLSFVATSINNNDEPNEKKNEGDAEFKSAKHYFFEKDGLPQRLRFGNMIPNRPSGEYADKYLKYFEIVENDVKKNNGKMKECIKNDDGNCQAKTKKKKKVQVKARVIEKRRLKMEMQQREEDERMNDKKKNECPNENRDLDNPRAKKWKSCSIKPSLKSGNESGCEEIDYKNGDWFSKYSEGRERCRRDQKISGWQFERAKSRANSRIGDAFWQFSRAYGRQTRRMHPYMRKKKVKYFSRKGFSFKSYSWM